MRFSSIGRSAQSLLLVFTFSAVVGGAEGGLAPTVGVLVLRNGEVLAGAISRAGDRYLVLLGHSGELRIPAADVEMVCRDREEAYFRKRAAAAPRGVKGHLDLADWCLRQSLVSRAADELLEVMALEPQHPAIPLLNKRVQATVSQTLGPPPPSRSNAPGVSLDELERTVRQLPADSVERFTVQVQPLLINRCGASSCHGDKGESEFHLVRGNAGQTLLRRFTQRNLHAVMQKVNRESPADSPLVTVPAGPHGPLATPVFREADKQQWRLLTEWVQGLKAGAKEEPPVAAAAASHLMPASFLQPVPLPGATADRSGVAGPSLPTGAAARGAGDGAPAASPTRPRSPDPFDPEQFNRRRGATEPVTPP